MVDQKLEHHGIVGREYHSLNAILVTENSIVELTVWI